MLTNPRRPTLGPLPTWTALAQALRTPRRAEGELARCWSREGDVAGWLSRSGWSLALIALWRGRRGGTAPVVWVPDFFCNGSLEALRQTGAKLVFYVVNGELAPDLAACRELAAEMPPDVLVVAHYFGRPTPLNAIRDFCARHGTWLVEDAAHALRPCHGIGADGDFVIYSPHKHLALPDGAVLVARGEGPGRLGPAGLEELGSPEDWATQLAERMRTLGHVVPRSHRHEWIWLAKRVLQMLGLRNRRHAAAAFEEPAAPVDPVPCSSWPPPSLSPLAKRLLVATVSTLAVAAKYRQRNGLVWDARYRSEDPTVRPAARAAAREWTPYLAAYEVDSPAAAEVYSRWTAAHVPVVTWPDLPPEVSACQGSHQTAWRLRHSRLYLPVHQSLRTIDLLPREPAVGEEAANLELAWDAATSHDWAAWLARAGRSNLLQSWGYGDAKSAGTPWKVRRAVWMRGGEPFAMAQLFERRLGKLVRVVRLNRGPVVFGAADATDIDAVWREIAGWGCWWRGRLLSAAPDHLLSGTALADLARLGFYQRTPVAWESIWLDIGIELDVLRRQLDRKWRNMLTASEKAGLDLEIGGSELFEWMMARYRELVADKGFVGVPVEVFRAWRAHLVDRPDDLLVLRALHEGQPVAGVCVARHGSAATYLIGWNGPAGRALKANQYLLWQAITHLRQDGVRHFDLGGINNDETPGITAFKMGLNGERYELVGEYWKW